MKLPEENDILWGYTSFIVKSLARIMPDSQACLKSSLLSEFDAISDMDLQRTFNTPEDGIESEEDPKAILMEARGVCENFVNAPWGTKVAPPVPLTWYACAIYHG